MIEIDDPLRDDVLALLEEHLADMYATSPAESVHALDPAALAAHAVTFFTAREHGVLLGCAALRDLGGRAGEVKSMRTATPARGRGVASALLDHVLAHARGRGMTRISLETGVEDYFAAARRLYERHGFVEGEPFDAYLPDPNSVFYTRPLGA